MHSKKVEAGKESSGFRWSSNPFTTDGFGPYDQAGNERNNTKPVMIRKMLASWVTSEAGTGTPRLITKVIGDVTFFRASYMPGVTDLEAEVEVKEFLSSVDPWYPTLGRGIVPKEYDDAARLDRPGQPAGL